MQILFAPLTGIDVQKQTVQNNLCILQIRLSVNQNSQTLEQVASKMQRSHLDLLQLLLDDLRHAGARPEATTLLDSLKSEQSKILCDNP